MSEKDFKEFDTTQEAVKEILQAINEGYFQDKYYYYMYNSDSKKRLLYRNAIYYVLLKMSKKVALYVNSNFILSELTEEVED